MERLPIVAVFGGGSTPTSGVAARVRTVARSIAESGCHLLTGGGGGVMAVAAESFTAVDRGQRRGLCLGVLPAGRDPAVYPNPWVEIPVRTHLAGADPRSAASRNPINVLTADFVVVFPGSTGTRAELELAAQNKSEQTIAVLEPREAIGDLAPPAVAALGIEVVASATATVSWLADRLSSR